MKTSRIFLSGCTALAVGLSTAVGWAAPANHAAIESLTASSVVGQLPNFLGGNSTPQSDPFTASGRGRDGNPPVQQTGPMGSQPQMNQNMASTDAQLLLQARKWLAVGDTRRAQEYVNQAKSRGVQYGAFGDTPRKIEDAVNMQSSLMENQAQAGNTEAFRRQYATHLLEQCDWLLKWGATDEAESLAHSVKSMNVVFSPYERNPEMMLSQIAQARGKNTQQNQPGAYPGNFASQAGPRYDNTVQAAASFGQSGGVQQAGGSGNYSPYANQAVYQGSSQGSVQPVQGLTFPNQPAPATGMGANATYDLFNQAETAIQQNDPNRARQIYQQLQAMSNRLDPASQQRVHERLALLGSGPQGAPSATEPSALRQQVSADLAETQRRARERREVYPRESLRMLEDARFRVAQAPLDDDSKGQLLRRVDGDIAMLHRFIEENAPQIQLDDQNRAVLAEIDRERAEKVEIQQRLATLVNDYNNLMDQQRFAEAELIARRARDMAPREPIVQQLMEQSRLIRSITVNQDIRRASQDGFMAAIDNVNDSSIPFDDNSPIKFLDAPEWDALTRNRAALSTAERVRSEREIEIEQKLRTPVSLRFTNAPLSEVIDYLGRLAEVNIHLDPQGLGMEGVTSATPIQVELATEVSLKSALNLVLEPLRLDYVIKDEVLKITSEQLRDGEVYTQTYNVADLVIPIPNFLPSPEMGLPSFIRQAYENAGVGANAFRPSPMSGLLAANGDPAGNVEIDPAVMANLQPNAGAGFANPLNNANNPGGPGGLGGASQPSFDDLIQLITSTVHPYSWDAVGGSGTIREFDTNLSLVVSQTQEVHEEITDLLQQLRRLQDLQVTIEVRFITLNDNFFERIGVDFDFDIDDDTDRPFQVFGRPQDAATAFAGPPFNVGAGNPARDVQDRDHGPSATVGMSMPGVFSSDLDIPVAQGSFPLAIPQFGGFQPGAGAQVGFAILSDLEAYFFIEASQGDRRSNVLQAPKVTLFNGQSATISDTSQTPFVISIIPVVGDFSAAQQPIVAVLNEGTHLTVNAVASEDRRFVRMSVVPFFSTIEEVNEFSFDGTTTEAAAAPSANDLLAGNNNTTINSQSATTVQLPTFSFITVSTTVSVPDGGTVLLGGIKRLSEGRNEFGVPLLSKVPYVNRLFRNVAIGRETQSLMMMVTPRIIIQEEEERMLLGPTQ